MTKHRTASDDILDTPDYRKTPDDRSLQEKIQDAKEGFRGTVAATLAERGERYGKFKDHAVIAQHLQEVLHMNVTQQGYNGGRVGWSRLAPDQKQALTTICDKIARILNGDPDYIDNWHDIQGYAKLVEDRLHEEKRT